MEPKVEKLYRVTSPVDSNFKIITKTTFTVGNIKALKKSIADYLSNKGEIDGDRLVVSVTGSDRQLLEYYVEHVLPENYNYQHVLRSGINTMTVVSEP